MTDLPRFHRGNVGELTFEHVNDMMRRLDALQPIIEQAAVLTQLATNPKPNVFLSYATKLPQTTSSQDRYQWEEVLFDTQDLYIHESAPNWEDALEYGVNFRKGGQPDDKGDIGDDYGVRADPLADFDEGLCITMAVRRIDRKLRHILVPLSLQKGQTLFVVANGIGVQEVITPDYTLQGYAYSGKSIAVTASGEYQEAQDATLLDLSYNEINLPSHNTGAEMSYHVMNENTVVTPSWISGAYAYLGTLPRLDFTC